MSTIQYYSTHFELPIRNVIMYDCKKDGTQYNNPSDFSTLVSILVYLLRSAGLKNYEYSVHWNLMYV